MRKYAFLAIALVVVGALLGAQLVGAQEFQPSLCTDSNFDLNGNGLISQDDGAAWKAIAVQCVDREAGQGFISAEACRLIIGDPDFDLLDVNGDGQVNLDDSEAMGIRMWACFPRFLALPR